MCFWEDWVDLGSTENFCYQYPIFECIFFDNFIDKTSTYKIIASVKCRPRTKKSINIKGRKLSILALMYTFGGQNRTSFYVPEHKVSVYSTWDV